MKNPIKGHYDTKRLKWGDYPLCLSSQGQKGKEKQGKKKKKKKETGKIQGLDYVSLQVLRVKRYSPPIIK